MNLEHCDIDSAVNRDRITEWVREKKPAFTIGKPQSRTLGHIRFICGLYQLQVQEGRWFAHEQPTNASTWKMRELVGLRELEGVFDSDFWWFLSAFSYESTALTLPAINERRRIRKRLGADRVVSRQRQGLWQGLS